MSRLQLLDMKYIVVTPAGELSKIYIVPDGRVMSMPFESWALNDGKRIMFATIKMHKILQNQHFAGSYEQGAMYAYTYEEMCAIITANIGPSDRERYEAFLKEDSDPVLIKDNSSIDHLPKWHAIAYALWKTLVLVIKVSIKSLNTVIFLVLLPLIIKWINGFRK